MSHFRVALSFISKRVLVHNLSYRNEIYLHVHCLAKNLFPHERLFTRTRFDTEVKSNSEMAFYLHLPVLLMLCVLVNTSL